MNFWQKIFLPILLLFLLLSEQRTEYSSLSHGSLSRRHLPKKVRFR